MHLTITRPRLQIGIKKRTFGVNFLIMVPIVIGTWFFSLFMLQVYVLGDQAHYTQFWYDASRTSLKHLPKVQFFDISSVEPIFGLIIWTASRIFERNEFIAAMNAVFMCALALNLRRIKAPWYVIILMLTNYYTLVVLVPAERLKFALLVFLVGLLFRGWQRGLLIVASPLVHLQMIIVFAVMVAARGGVAIKSLITGGKLDRYSAVIAPTFLIAAMGLVTYFSAELAHKMERYQKDDIFGVLKILILYATSLIFLKDRWRVSGAFVSIAVFAFALGPERTNMVAYMAFCYFFISQRKSHNLVFLAIALYFVVRSFSFVSDVLQYGVAIYS